MSKPYGIIYRARNIINEKVYTGQTICGLQRRKTQHINNIGQNQHHDFYRDLKEYGVENFVWDIARHCYDPAELNYWEKYFVAYYKKLGLSYNKKGGGGCYYNIRKEKPISQKRLEVEQRKADIAEKKLLEKLAKEERAFNKRLKKLTIQMGLSKGKRVLIMEDGSQHTITR